MLGKVEEEIVRAYTAKYILEKQPVSMSRVIADVDYPRGETADEVLGYLKEKEIISGTDDMKNEYVADRDAAEDEFGSLLEETEVVL